MSRISKCALGLIAASLALGGVQFGMASDNGLARAIRGDARLWQTDSLSIASAVNRSAKSDRAVALPAPMDTATLSFQLPGLTNMSVAMRLPSADASRLRPAAPTEVARTTSVLLLFVDEGSWFPRQVASLRGFCFDPARLARVEQCFVLDFSSV